MKHLFKRSIALLCVLALLIGILPVAAYAADATYGRVTEIKDGDKIVIVCPAEGLALSSEIVATYYKAGVAITPDGDTITNPDEALVWTVSADGTGFNIANANGDKISIEGTYSSIPYNQANDAWHLEEAETEGCVYVVNENGKHLSWSDKGNFAAQAPTSQYTNEGFRAMQIYALGAEGGGEGGGEELPEEKEIVGEFVLLSTTDMHGRCWDKNILNDTNMNNSMLNVATAVKQMRETYGENVVLIDNGDTYQGTPVSTLQISEYTQGNTTDPNPMAISMKYIGYDLATVGNHEFNYAWSTMSDIYAYLESDVEGLSNVLPACANLYYEDGTNVVEPYGIKTIKDEYGDEYKIAILAFVTPDCTRWDVPDNYPGMRFYHPDNAYRSIRWEAEKWVQIIEENEAPDFVIVTFHSGAGSAVADEDLVYGENTENQVASMIAGTTGIDVVIAGHDHNGSYSGSFFKNADGEDVLVVNGAGNNLTASVFEIDIDGNISLKEHSDLGLSKYAADAGLKALIKPYADAASAYVNNTCGTAIGNWNYVTKFYLQQSDTMDLIGRAQMAQGTIHLEEKFNTEEKKAALFAETGLTDLTVDASSTSVVINGTYNVSAGDLSMKDIYRMYRYDNSLYLMPVTGAELRGFLEFNAATHLSVNTASGTPVFGTKGDNFTNPIFYGLDFKYDMSRPEYDRIIDLKFSDGREVIDDEVYIFAVNNYHLGNASGPFADYTTEDAIWSQTDDMGGGFVQDLIAEFLAAETAANGGVAPAPSNWEIVYTGEIVEGKAEGEYIGNYADVADLATGDKILIYYPAGNTLVSNVASGAKLAACEDVTTGKSDDGIAQAGTDSVSAVFTVTKNEDGTFSFADQEGLFMTSGATGNGVKMAEGINDLSKWEIIATNGGWYLRNIGAAYNGNSQYLEFYSAFTTYGLNGGGAAYTFQFYKLAKEVEDPAVEEIVILYTNDIHTYVDKALSYDNIADMKAALEAEGKTVILVDAGDHIQGTAYGSMDKGATIIELMEAAGYDLATLGNHEFDYGMERALEIALGSAFPYISANFYHEENGVKGETVLDAYKIFEVNGMKIALIGMTTPESFTKSTPAYFQDENGNYIYGIAGGEDGSALYAEIQVAIDAAIAEGADYVIGLGHLGDDIASQPWTSEELIANTTGLDAFIDGHSHSTVEGKMVADKNGNEVLLTQTGEYFGAIGKMTITEEGISTELVTEWTGSDEAVAAIKNAWIAEINEKLGEVIGTTDVTFDNYDAEGNRLVRKYETNTGDFAADALYFLFDNMGLEVDLAIMNGGGVRNKAITGELSYLTAKEIHTFGNVACLQTVTGQQILDALEWGARQTPVAEVGGLLHVAGLTYEVDASIESTVQQDDKGVWTGAPTGEYRVKNVKVYNKETGAYEALDLTATYNMAGYNYTLRDLGDGFAMFDGAINVLDYVMEDYQVLATYIKAFPVGDTGLPTVGATNSPLLTKYSGMLLDYGTVNGSGRLVIAEAEEEPWDGVIIIGGLEPNLWTTKYGNVYTNCAAENFFGDLGLAYGDLATVKFLDQELILPVVPNYSYVDSGKPALLVAKNEQGNPTGYAFLAINMGNFLETYGIATKGTDEAGNWYWTACEGVEFPIVVTFELYEKEGYLAEYLLHDLTRTNNREDYAHLTDEEFANFREVTTTGMGDNVLYRSSSPINPEIGRNTYADAAAAAAGVKTFVNLADNQEEAEGYEGFAETYYSKQNIIYLCLGVDFAAEDFQAGLAEGFRYMIANEGPYLIHCTEGKDRAGFTHALLECFMGATYEEVIADYMVTYYNYYGIEVGTSQYDAIANSNIVKSLKIAFGVEDLTTADLAAEAAEYLAAIGLADEEIEELYIALGGNAEPTIEIEEVLVPSTLREGAQIPAYITLPADYDEASEFPIVFMLHGHGGNHNEWGGYDSISNGLAESGIIAVTLDFPGCGASTESFTLNTMTNMKSDVLDVIEYVTTNYSIDEDRVGGFGYSMGGRIVLEMTAEELYSFDSIELVAPAEDYEDLKGLFGGAENWEVLKAEANANGYVEFSTIYSTLPLSKEWFADLEKYPDGLIELAAEKYEGNSLVIWATDDTTVSPWVAEGVAEALGSATLLTYTNGHSYGFYGTDPYTKRITTDGSVGFFFQELRSDNDELSGYIHKIEDDGDIILTIDPAAMAEIKNGDELNIRFNDMFGSFIYGEEIVIEDGRVVMKAVDWTFLTKVEAEGGVQWYYNDEITVPIHVTIEKASIFEDVKEGAWYYDYVMMMAEAGIIKGVTPTTFDPEGNITRGQFATMLYRLFGEEDVTGMEHPFTDVADGRYYTKAIIWAYNVGLINGTTSTTFAPEENISREQVATILYRATVAMGIDASGELNTDITSFEDDEKVSKFAKDAMTWACGAGLINGNKIDNSGKLYLQPQGNATRAQAAKIFVMWILYLDGK